jgi:hypothetical protein
MKKLIIFVLILISIVSSAFAQPNTSLVFLNEFHYDGITNYGQSDQNEFVEIAVHNSIATNPVEMAKLRLILYSAGALENGTPTIAKGRPYDSTGLLYKTSETVHNFETGGFMKCPVAGTTFTLISKSLPILQDVPAGFAIVYENQVVQLLSYEKPFKIAPSGSGGGPAAGSTTTVILVAPGDTAMETATTPNNHSIGLMGTGVSYSNFSWRDDVTMVATPCAPNTNTLGATQSFTTGPLPAGILFTLRTANRDVTLRWTSGSEDPGTTFIIERADENTNSFRQVATVNGRATRVSSSVDYTHSFNNMDAGVYTFRIKQVSASGLVQYSPALKAFVKTAFGHLISAVYPNPASFKATFTLSLEKTEKVSIELRNATGQRVKVVHNGIVQANNTSLFQVNTSEVANGKYFLVIEGETFREVRTLVVSH